jgi:hypothetical protein
MRVFVKRFEPGKHKKAGLFESGTHGYGDVAAVEGWLNTEFGKIER